MRVGELHGGQVVHDRDIDETPGIVHHVEQGLQIRGAATGTQWWGCTLREKGQSRCVPCQGRRHHRALVRTVCLKPGPVGRAEPYRLQEGEG